jgi:4-hydroxymandelate oxidase
MIGTRPLSSSTSIQSITSSTYPLSFLEGIENEAKLKLPDQGVYDYIAGGAGNGSGIEANIQAFANTEIVSMVLNGGQNPVVVSSPLTLLKNSSSPILIAPTGYHKLCDPEGEVATARAARETNTIMIVSAMATVTIEEIAKDNNAANLWLQLYIPFNRDDILELVQRADKIGYGALVLTVDTPVAGERPLEKKHEFKPEKYGCKPVNFSDRVLGNINQQNTKNFKSVTWDDVSWLQSNTKLHIILKGILNPKDAERALNYNIAGIVVSNHGGKQLMLIAIPLSKKISLPLNRIMQLLSLKILL